MSDTNTPLNLKNNQQYTFDSQVTVTMREQTYGTQGTISPYVTSPTIQSKKRRKVKLGQIKT